MSNNNYLLTFHMTWSYGACLQAFAGSEVTHDLEAFKAGCDVVVANRWSDELADVADKVYTRDLFKRD